MGLRIRQSTIKGIASAVSKLHTIDERMLYEQIEQAISTHYPNYAPPSYDDDCLGLVEPQAFGDMMEDSDVEDTAEKGATGAILLVEEEEEEETDEVEITGEYILIRDDGSEPFIKQEFGAGLIWESLVGARMKVETEDINYNKRHISSGENTTGTIIHSDNIPFLPLSAASTRSTPGSICYPSSSL
jgi:hypothetical protein